MGLRELELIVAAGVCSAVLIVLLRPLFRRHALARPNARSSHAAPTPQGGGVAVILAVMLTLGAAAFAGPERAAFADALPLGAAVVLLTVVGAIDDMFPIAVLPRLAMQAVAVILVVSMMPAELRAIPIVPIAVERAAEIVAGLWFVNLVNFMDGIDWMTVAETVPSTASIFIFALFGAAPQPAGLVALTLCGAMLGFAPFNRPVAKLFLGDVGSLPIGLLLFWLLLQLAGSGHLAAALLLPLYYVADTTITLLRRIMRGERITEAHRTHFYQLAIGRGFSVMAVVQLVFGREHGACRARRPVDMGVVHGVRCGRAPGRRHVGGGIARRYVAGQTVSRVLVTGASGFIGRALVPALLAAGYDVRAAVRHLPVPFAPPVEVATHGDLDGDVDWRALMADADFVIHLAGIAHTGPGVAEAYYDHVNHLATAALAEAARVAGIKRVVFVSTIRAQTGPRSDHVLTEADEPRPTDPYGRSKLAAEVALARSDADFTVLRPVVVYGSGVKGNLRTLMRLAALPIPLPFGAFTNHRSLLSVHNLAAAIAHVLQHAASSGATYVVADPQPVSLADIVTALRAGLGKAPRLLAVPPGLIGLSLAMLGRSRNWDQLNGQLVVNPNKLLAAGWRPDPDTTGGLAAMARE